jgi:predicted MPP superfamily phosphohydrolase
MSRVLMFIVFLSVVSLVYFGMHYFVYRNITRSIPVSATVRTVLKVFFIVSGLSFFLSQFFSRVLHLYWLNYYAYIWLGVMSISFFIFFIQWLLAKILPQQKRLLAIVALTVIGIASVFSLVNGLQRPVVRRFTIPLKNLSQDLAGFSIVQLSDLHLESFKSKEVIEYIVDTVNALKPDLIVITGDLLDSNICDDEYFCERLLNLQAPHGVIAVTGNHEFYAGLDIFMQMAGQANLRVLRNDMAVIADELQIIGLDDDAARQFRLKGPDLPAVIGKCDPKKPIIVLYHRPTGFDEAVKRGVDLQLSGHTHAGQIPPLDLIVWLVFKYHTGLFEKDGSYIYTSPGTGFWGPPMRLFSRCTITHFTLQPQKSRQGEV